MSTVVGYETGTYIYCVCGLPYANGLVITQQKQA